MRPDLLYQKWPSAPRTPRRGFLPLSIVGALLLACGAPSSHGPDTNMLLPGAINDWEKEASPVTYDRETIFDYINGAGEVYRSYGFEDVVVARYENPQGLAFTVEIFDMGDPADAYGVFSYAREQEEAGIGAAYERRGSILCFWQDRYYVCVAAEQRDPDPGPLLEEAARVLSEQLPPPGPRPALVEMLPTEGLLPLSERFFHLHQTLNYHFYLVRENVLNLSVETDAVLGRYQPGSAILLIVDYGEEGPASDALDSFRHLAAQNRVSAETSGAAEGSESGLETLNTSNWNRIGSVQQGRFVVIVLNGESQSTVESLVQRTIETISERAFQRP